MYLFLWESNYQSTAFPVTQTPSIAITEIIFSTEKLLPVKPAWLHPSLRENVILIKNHTYQRWHYVMCTVRPGAKGYGTPWCGPYFPECGCEMCGPYLNNGREGGVAH